MVETNGHCRETLAADEAVDAVAVFLAEKEVARLRIDRQAPEGALAGALREGDHEPGRAGRVDWRGRPRVEPVDLRRGVAAPAVTQDDEPSGARQPELRGPRHRGGDDVDPRRAGRLGLARARSPHEGPQQGESAEATEP